MTSKLLRRLVENDEYGAFVRRILCAYAGRVSDGEALAHMLGLAGEIDTAVDEGVKGLRGCAYSWAEIGARLGITRQARNNAGEHRLDTLATAGAKPHTESPASRCSTAPPA